MTDARRTRLFVLLAAILAAVTAAPAADPPASAPPDPIASLAWLEGVWSGQSGALTMEEYWTAPAGGAILGLHRDVKGGRMVSFEFFRIQVSDGAATYWASPQNAPPTPFRLKEMGPGKRMVFENPEHDFPTRILYWVTDDDTLHARIEGPKNAAEKAMEWAWKRVTPAAR